MTSRLGTPGFTEPTKIKVHTQPGGEFVASTTQDNRTIRICGTTPGYRGPHGMEASKRATVVDLLKMWITWER